MQSIGVWLLMLVVLVMIANEADAQRKTKTRTSSTFKLKIKTKSKTKTRNKRSERGNTIAETFTLPCDISEYDINKDGAISKTEMADLVAPLNNAMSSPEGVDLIIEQLDVNGDGQFRIEEFYLQTHYKKNCLY